MYLYFYNVDSTSVWSIPSYHTSTLKHICIFFSFLVFSIMHILFHIIPPLSFFKSCTFPFCICFDHHNYKWLSFILGGHNGAICSRVCTDLRMIPSVIALNTNTIMHIQIQIYKYTNIQIYKYISKYAQVIPSVIAFPAIYGGNLKHSSHIWEWGRRKAPSNLKVDLYISESRRRKVHSKCFVYLWEAEERFGPWLRKGIRSHGDL